MYRILLALAPLLASGELAAQRGAIQVSATILPPVELHVGVSTVSVGREPGVVDVATPLTVTGAGSYIVSVSTAHGPSGTELRPDGRSREEAPVGPATRAGRAGPASPAGEVLRHRVDYRVRDAEKGDAVQARVTYVVNTHS